MKKRYQLTRLAAFWLAVVLLLTGCGSKKAAGVEKTFFMMDTVVSIRLYCDRATAEPIFDRCQEILEQVEALLSKTVEGSLTDTFNRTGHVTLTEPVAELFYQAQEVFLATGGAFDPTVAPLVSFWQACGQEDRLPEPAELTALCAHVGMDRLNLSGRELSCDDGQVALDMGAIGKGFAIRQVLNYLNETEVPGGVLSFGGNIAVFGNKPDGSDYRIALRDPLRSADTVGELTMTGGVVSVSGDYERYVEIGGQRYHHILNPATGYPAENGLHCVAVVCADPVLADALSTALFVMGEEQAVAFYRSGVYDFEAIFATDDRVRVTPGLTRSFQGTGQSYQFEVW